MSSRIRVGLIGLSTSSQVTSWASRAHLPYLQSPQGQKLFEIVALCNSSKSSAEKSIEEYKLGSSVKTYDSAKELAEDPNVDLVVNVTGVERHHELVLPVVQAGKNVFTELPLASNMEQMQELMQAAQEKKPKTVIGMQGQTTAITKLLRETITSGKIGKVISSTWTGTGSFLGEKPTPTGMTAFLYRKTGGNMMSVNFLHSINYVLAVLGEVESHDSLLGNGRPSVDVIDPSQDNKKVETVQKDTPDQIFFHARLASGALLSYAMRGGDPFAGQPGVVWTIYGEKGEFRITCPAAMLDIMPQGAKIELHVFGEEKPQELEIPEDHLSDLPHPAQNVGRIYDAYANGKQGGEGGYPDWELGFKRHQMMEEMWQKSDRDGVWKS